MTKQTGTRRRVAAAAILGAMGLAAVNGCGGGSEGAAGGGGGFQRPPTPVEVARVNAGDVSNVFSTVGSIRASESVTIVSEIDGIIAEMPFREGDPVAKGTLLVRLNDRELAAALARAQATYEQRHAAYERVRSVVQQGAGTPQDLDDASAALKVAEADVALADARLDKTRIRAPFAGVIGPRDPSPGAYLRAGTPVATLSRLAEVEVDFSVPERFSGELARGLEVRVTTPARPDLQGMGQIHVVDPVLDRVTRSARVIARVPNPGGVLRPGMSANVSTVLWERGDAVTIPSEAVFAEGDRFFAYAIAADSTVQRTELSLGVRLPGRVQVLSGVVDGDLVVRAGHQKLYPGAKVMPIVSRED
ncbi:efflux RND transporter periplasmic adaptor subunit, partial [bacterium]|nr:efflux RND transporter periplasmic adaptor subunit [bacterium]